MREGSSELAQLPHFPADVPVRAIAGNLEVFYQYLDSSAYVKTEGDGIVPVKSATAEFTDTGKGDGRFVFGCDLRHYDVYGSSSPVLSFNGGQCWHNDMYKTGYVQQSVVNGIQEYLSNQSRFAGIPHTVGDGMVIYLPGGARVVGLGGEGPGSFQVTCPGGECPMFGVYNPNEVGGSDALGWRDWEISRCNDASGQIKQKAIVVVGGKSAHYYEAAICKPGSSRDTAGFWYVDDGSAFVIAVALGDHGRAEIDAILAGARWK